MDERGASLSAFDTDTRQSKGERGTDALVSHTNADLSSLPKFFPSPETA